ncbi:MAG: antitoxin [Thermoplasmata archaeon]
MPKAVVDLSEHANRIVNVVKARDGLRGKNEAIEAIVAAYEERILDPALQPEFVESLQRVRRGPFRKIRSPAELLEAPK